MKKQNHCLQENIITLIKEENACSVFIGFTTVRVAFNELSILEFSLLLSEENKT